MELTRALLVGLMAFVAIGCSGSAPESKAPAPLPSDPAAVRAEIEKLKADPKLNGMERESRIAELQKKL